MTEEEVKGMKLNDKKGEKEEVKVKIEKEKRREN